MQSSKKILLIGLFSILNVITLAVIPVFAIDLSPSGGEGYSYFNSSGIDPNYIIFSPGYYTLVNGFETANNSAIIIKSSDVILDGNTKSITGNGSITGIVDDSVASNITIKNFDGISRFYSGINSSAKRVSITNNKIHDNIRESLDSSKYGGINSYGDNAIISGNNIFNNSICGVNCQGNNSIISDNLLYNHSTDSISMRWESKDLKPINITVTGNVISNSEYGIDFNFIDGTILGNTIFACTNGIYVDGSDVQIVKNTVYGNYGDGIQSMGLNHTIIENNVTNNHNWGILSEDSGYTSPWTTIEGNNASFNNWGGVQVIRDNATIYGNIASNNSINGILSRSSNTKLLQNIVYNNYYGVSVYDNYNGQLVENNQIYNNTVCGIEIKTLAVNNNRAGSIFNNNLQNLNNLQANEYPGSNASHFNWTNPIGPQPGINIMGGPYIAGNYWSNPNRTGWSDQQPGNANGYTNTPYEIIIGVNDTAPLVRVLAPTPIPTVTPTITPTASPTVTPTTTPTTSPTITPTVTPTPTRIYILNATSDDLGYIKPSGFVSVPAGGNTTFQLQGRAGAEITNLTVDGLPATIQEGNRFTISNVVADHTIRLNNAVKMNTTIACFSANILSGQNPLTVNFTDASYGTPSRWFWTFGDGNNSTLQNPVHRYTESGFKTVKLWVRNLYSSSIITKKGYIDVSSSGSSFSLETVPSENEESVN